MTVLSEVILNVARLLAHELGEYEVAGEGLLMPSAALLEADGLKLAAPLAWQLTVRSSGGDDDFILEGTVSGVAVMECRRCLDPVEVPIRSSFYYPMVYRASRQPLTLIEGADGDDALLFGHPQIDFTELITELFSIDLPLTVLCREDCRGLSPAGVNLNRHPEAAKEAVHEAPSPFAVLKDLKL